MYASGGMPRHWARSPRPAYASAEASFRAHLQCRRAAPQHRRGWRSAASARRGRCWPTAPFAPPPRAGTAPRRRAAGRHLVERLADRLEFVPLRVRDPMAEVAVPDLADALGQGRQGLGDVPERDRAMMPAARLTLVSSTSPLGSMPNSPADVATTASCTGSPRRNSASRNSRTPRNGIQ